MRPGGIRTHATLPMSHIHVRQGNLNVLGQGKNCRLAPVSHAVSSTSPRIAATLADKFKPPRYSLATSH